MRPTLLLLGIWHGLVSIGGALLGAWEVGERRSYDHVWNGLAMVFGGFVSIFCLACVAQKGRESQLAGVFLTAPFVWHAFLHGWPLPTLLYVPGAVVGAVAMLKLGGRDSLL